MSVTAKAALAFNLLCIHQPTKATVLQPETGYVSIDVTIDLNKNKWCEFFISSNEKSCRKINNIILYDDYEIKLHDGPDEFGSINYEKTIYRINGTMVMKFRNKDGVFNDYFGYSCSIMKFSGFPKSKF